LIADIKGPNGIAFSPDETTLYVSNWDRDRPAVFAFSVEPDGTLSEGRVFADAKRFAAAREGAPDGLKVDRLGNVFASGPGGIYVFTPDSTLLGRIDPGVAPSNCAWGDDGSVLYITAGSAVYRVQTLTKGAGF
jgi:gluconolactonase